MKTTTLTLLLGALALAGLAAFVLGPDPADAHHAFGAEFDREAPVRMRGTITRLEWVNPHTWIHLEVTNEDGRPTSFSAAGSAGTASPRVPRSWSTATRPRTTP